jgi:hypothetical protein
MRGKVFQGLAIGFGILVAVWVTIMPAHIPVGKQANSSLTTPGARQAAQHHHADGETLTECCDLAKKQQL